ncbi:MAG: PAS domain S-box protein [Boseongicola sp.]
MTYGGGFNFLAPGDALTALDRINSGIVDSTTLESMLSRVLDELLMTFRCDRAWVMYPCDPTVNEVTIMQERTRPEWPGATSSDGRLPVYKSTREFLDVCQKSDGPVWRDDELNPIDRATNKNYADYGVKSMMAIPMRPHKGPAWLLGIHHCAKDVVYRDAVPLFHAVGNRIANGLTTYIAMDELRESEKRYRALVDHAPEAIVILDLDVGTFIEANPKAAQLFGYSVDELIGSFGPAQVSPEFQTDGQPSVELAMKHIHAALNGEFPKFEWTHMNANGEHVPCEISLGRFPDPKRRLIRGSITDITERKHHERQRLELETRLSHAQKLETVGQMTGGVAHDFNNLLTVILGNLELLSLDSRDDSEKDYIQSGIQATLKGADLTQKMLSFARRAQLQPKVLDISKIVREVDSWMSRTLPATIDIKKSVSEDLWPVEADLASTESAILNLIINARDAMPDGGKLTIETDNIFIGENGAIPSADDLKPGKYVMLGISDTGSGIAPENLERVFEPFFTTKGTGQGSGLGLSMVHGFMKQSGGTVHIFSECGVGTTIKLYFKAVAQYRPKTNVVKPRLIGSSTRSARILVAEDQQEVMSTLVRILESAGHEVVSARDGDSAAGLFASAGRFDLLLTDMVMPDRLQGPTLAHALRKTDPLLSVVFMSGYAREASLHSDMLRHTDVRLMKPVSRTTLLEAVEKSLHAEAQI